jgi:DICT domain-containing protein
VARALEELDVVVELTERALTARVAVPRRGTKRLLLAISKHVEAQVAAQGEAAVVLATFQEARHFTPRSAARYERLASHAALVALWASGFPASRRLASGVRISRSAIRWQASGTSA